MLGRFELLFGILGGYIASIIALAIMKRKSKGKLPKGSIIIEVDNGDKDSNPPGTKFSRMIVTVGLGINSIVMFLILILLIFDLWDEFTPFIALNFPIWLNWSNWLNWSGFVGLWVVFRLGTVIMYYNVNYTAAYKKIPGTYVLATGGPYSLIRHPMYVTKFWQMIFLFLTTGVWIILLGCIIWLGLPTQAKGEEKLLEEKFEGNYIEYVKKAGRFFPKIQIFQKKEQKNC